MNWLTKTLHALSPNCREAIRLQSDALDRPLTRLQRIGLRIHLALCVWCSRYGKQIAFLHQSAHDHPDKLVAPVERNLSSEARERIKRKLHSVRSEME